MGEEHPRPDLEGRRELARRAGPLKQRSFANSRLVLPPADASEGSSEAAPGAVAASDMRQKRNLGRLRKAEARADRATPVWVSPLSAEFAERAGSPLGPGLRATSSC